MNSKKSFDDSIFVPYDDNNIEHVMAGPDYGQPESSSAWNEYDSHEYPDYVADVEDKILKFPLLKITKF
jgi:hypothetical protein